MLVYVFIMGFAVFFRYIHFFKQTAAILYFCHFQHNIKLLLNIALSLLDVHYFDAESSKKYIPCKHPIHAILIPFCYYNVVVDVEMYLQCHDDFWFDGLLWVTVFVGEVI